MTTSEAAFAPAALKRPGYFRFVMASFGRAMLMIIRRRRAILAACVTLLPVIIPLAVALFYKDPSAVPGGSGVFVKMMETVFLKALAPLLALFFATMLVGEEIETHSMPYLLTRPIPRTALVLGKYLAYVAATTALVLPGMLLCMLACTTLAEFSVTMEVIRLFLRYAFIMMLSLSAYGAFCMFLGALMRFPIVLGVLYIFGWQKFMLTLPGYLDFSAIEKYLNALLPILAAERAKPTAQLAIGQFVKTEISVRPFAAVVVLLLVIAAFVLASSLTIRWREYTGARAVGG